MKSLSVYLAWLRSVLAFSSLTCLSKKSSFVITICQGDFWEMVCFGYLVYVHIYDDKTFLKYMLDCILCLSSLTATSGWKFSHPVKFLWSKVLLHDQRVNCWIQSWSALAGPNSINILIFFFIFPCLSENTCSLAKPKLDQSIKFERTKGNTCFNGYVFFFNVIESILFQDSSLGFATDFFLWYIICGQFLTSWCLREPNSS